MEYTGHAFTVSFPQAPPNSGQNVMNDSDLRQPLAGLRPESISVGDTLLQAFSQADGTTTPTSPRIETERQLAVVRMIQSRADRPRFVPSYLFADPAWDILLGLYYAELVQRRVSVSGLCIASNVPATTALRWIKTLENEGLISRARDPLDTRRYFMALTEAGLSAMDGYFTSQGTPQELPSEA